MKPPSSADTVTVHTGRLRRAADRLDDAAGQLAQATRHGQDLTAVPPGWSASTALDRLAVAVASSMARVRDQTQATGTALRTAAAAYEESDRSAMRSTR